MIVDGGTITNAKGPNVCMQANQWDAIIVEGNANQPQQLPGNVTDLNGNGVLYLKNATIENGHTMISMRPGHIPYPEHPEYWGGHVTAENTTFINTNNFTNYARVAEFMQYFPPDESKFIGCTISNVAGGMTHWSNFGVTYELNNFDSYQQHAILTYDAQINVVNGNIFDNNIQIHFEQAAIDLNHTVTLSKGSIIGDFEEGHLPNQFYGGYHSVYCSAGFTSQLPIKVENNIFVGGASSIYFDGISKYNIEGNDMIGSTYGTTVNATGSFFNIQRDNQFSETGVGIYAFYENSGYQFLSNCFDETRDVDVASYGGMIYESQGNASIAASNVFSQKISRRRIRFKEVPLQAEPDSSIFQYYIKEGTPEIITIERTYPRVTINGTNNGFVSFTSSAFDNEACGSSASPGPVNVSSIRPCDIPVDCDDIREYIEDLEDDLASDISTLSNLPFGSVDWFDLKFDITELLKCLQKAKEELIYCKGKEKMYDPLKLFFNDDDFEYRVLVFGTMVGNQDYIVARNYLKEMSPSNEEEFDFVSTQEINLNRLIDFNYVPSSNELNTLYSIGHKIFPLSANARSLYRYLTGEKIEIELPYDDGERSKPRSLGSEGLSLTLSPNPSKGIFALEYNHLPESTCKIYNLQGVIIDEKSNIYKDGSVNIDLSNQNDGMYILLVRERATGKLLFKENIIIIK